MVLLTIETVKIKDYLFSTNKLKVIRGASYLLDYLNQVVVVEILKNHGLNDKNDNYLYVAAGNAKVLVKDKDEAEKIIKEVEKAYSKIAPGAKIAASTVENKENKKIYVFDEIYKEGLSNKRIFEEVNAKGYAKEVIKADSAEPKSIDELKGLGLYRIKGSRKGKDSVMNGIQFIQNYELIIHPNCPNFITEISNYTWAKDKFDNKINKPIDDFNHLMDALRYALEGYVKGESFSFK